MKCRLLSTVTVAVLFGAAACGGESEEQQDTGIEIATPRGASLDTLPPGLIGSGATPATGTASVPAEADGAAAGAAASAATTPAAAVEPADGTAVADTAAAAQP